MLAEADRSRNAGLLQRARHLLATAQGQLQATSEPELRVLVLQKLARVHRDLNNLPEALQCYEAAVAACRGLNRAAQLANLIRHVGDVLVDDGRLDEAKLMYAEALATIQNSDERQPLILANCLRSCALLFEKTGRESEAIPMWREARTIYSQCAIEEGVAECDRHLEEF